MIQKDIIQELREGIELLKSSNSHLVKPRVNDYPSEKEAQQMLVRKTTWFWNMSTKGHLTFNQNWE